MKPKSSEGKKYYFNKTGFIILGKEPKPKKGTYGYLWKINNEKIEPLFTNLLNK